jgi:hypothetical protein
MGRSSIGRVNPRLARYRSWPVRLLRRCVVTGLAIERSANYAYRTVQTTQSSGAAAMVIDFGCPKCGRRFQAEDSLAGRNLRCKVCRQVFPIPAPAKHRSTVPDPSAPAALAPAASNPETPAAASKPPSLPPVVMPAAQMQAPSRIAPVTTQAQAHRPATRAQAPADDRADPDLDILEPETPEDEILLELDEPAAHSGDETYSLLQSNLVDESSRPAAGDRKSDLPDLPRPGLTVPPPRSATKQSKLTAPILVLEPGGLVSLVLRCVGIGLLLLFVALAIRAAMKSYEYAYPAAVDHHSPPPDALIDPFTSPPPHGQPDSLSLAGVRRLRQALHRADWMS